MRGILLLALLAASPAYGASLSGIVKDRSGAVVSQAAVTLDSPAGAFSAATGANGRFEFRNIPAGENRLAVTHDGFEPFSHTVTAGASSAPLAVTLQVAALKTVVQVSGGRSALRNSDPNYQALRAGSLRSVYRINNFVLTRDAGTFTFRSGSFSFLPPVLGRVTAAVFIGDANFQLHPAFDIAARHLKQISGSSTVDEDFDSLVVYFTDSTFDEIAAHAELVDQSPKAHQDVLHRLQDRLRSREWLPETYLQRIIDADDVPNMEAELLAELYNQTGGSFCAFIHGLKNPGLRFLLNPLGAVPQLPAPEEVALLNFDPSKDTDGIWYLSHTIAELQTGRVNSGEEKRLVAPEHYRIETAVSRNQHLTAACDLRFHPLRDGVRAVKFDLLPDMQVSRLSLDGREISFVQENRNRDGSFYAVLPQALAMGRAYQLTFEYDGSDLIRDHGGKLFVILPVQPWYPRVRGVSRATYDMTFNVPHGASVIATGDRVHSATEGGEDITQWVSRIPIPAAGFNYGYFYSKHRTDESSGFQLEAWLGSMGNKGFLMPNSSLGLDRSENAIRVFKHWFGEPPFNHLAITEGYYQGSMPGLLFAAAAAMTDDSGRYFGLAQRATAAGDLPLPVAAVGVGSAIAGPRFDESLPREVSRQWWGALVSPMSFHDEWLIRGLTDFSGSVYDMAAESDTNDFVEHWRLARIQLLYKTHFGVRVTEAAPLWLGATAEPILTERDDPAPYPPCRAAKPFVAPCTALTGMKGGYVIHMLRALMFDPAAGDKDFIGMIHDFTSTFANQNVTTEDFKLIVERHMKPQMDLEGNKRMDWFFREWVYGTELPSYRLEYSLTKGANGKLVLSGKLTQSGVSEQFRMRVPIYAKLGARNVLVGALNLTGNHTREFRAELPEEPKKVLLNAHNDVLCAEAEIKRVR